MKIKVNHKTHETIQYALFALGYVWSGTTSARIYTPSCNEEEFWWIYTEVYKKMSFSDAIYGSTHGDKEFLPPDEWRVL